jgi:dinuclear metal center YbgI/SA1388 family protein
MNLKEITDYLDNYLDIAAFRDDSTNGLQVENSENVEKIGLAVDACHEAILKAGNAQCNLLIVHHGLFWGKQELIIDNHFGRIRALIMEDIALYAAHLPLDGHSEVGHNIQIAKKIGLSDIEPFALYYGRPIGMKGKVKTPKSRGEIAGDLEKTIGYCRGLLEFGPEQIHSIGVVSGSATEPTLFRELKMQGVDLFITGEPKHGAYYLAQEYGLNIFYGGHYMTETFGMKALGKHLEKQLNIPTEFIDVPCIF